MAAPKQSEESRFVSTIHSNIKSPLIEITEDKLIVILTRFLQKVRRTLTWSTPLSLFVTLLLTILTADFNKAFLGISKEVWTAIFYISFAGSIAYTIYGGIAAWRAAKESTVENVVEKIKDVVDN